MSISRGDMVQAALWYNAEHAKEKQDAEVAITGVLRKVAANEGYIIGPVKWTEVAAEDRRIPDPPKEFMGTPKCLVGNAEVLALISQSSFVNQLGDADLERLRAITRKNTSHYLSDEECDAIIDDVGPNSAVRWLH